MIGIDGKLEFESEVFPGDGSHVFESKRTRINSPFAIFYLSDTY